MGGVYVSCEVGDVAVDEERHVVSAPLYMSSDTSLVGVALGIDRLVGCMARMVLPLRLGVS